MTQMPGAWSLEQVEKKPTGWIRTGTFVSARLYRCDYCKLLQLYDEA